MHIETTQLKKGLGNKFKEIEQEFFERRKIFPFFFSKQTHFNELLNLRDPSRKLLAFWEKLSEFALQI